MKTYTYYIEFKKRFNKKFNIKKGRGYVFRKW